MTSCSPGRNADILAHISPLYQRFRRLATDRFGRNLVRAEGAVTENQGESSRDEFLLVDRRGGLLSMVSITIASRLQVSLPDAQQYAHARQSLPERNLASSLEMDEMSAAKLLAVFADLM